MQGAMAPNIYFIFLAVPRSAADSRPKAGRSIRRGLQKHIFMHKLSNILSGSHNPCFLPRLRQRQTNSISFFMFMLQQEHFIEFSPNIFSKVILQLNLKYRLEKIHTYLNVADTFVLNRTVIHDPIS